MSTPSSNDTKDMKNKKEHQSKSDSMENISIVMDEHTKHRMSDQIKTQQVPSLKKEDGVIPLLTMSKKYVFQTVQQQS